MPTPTEMRASNAPCIEELARAVACDPETGKLTWLARAADTFATAQACAIWNRGRVGRPAFASVSTNGYLVGNYRCQQLKAHRVIWALVHGRWPSNLDHINGDRTDNRLSNLREATIAENGRNCKRQARNRSGVAGVSWNKDVRKYRVLIQADCQRFYLGAYASLDEAAGVRRRAERLLGFHPNHGREA